MRALHRPFSIALFSTALFLTGYSSSASAFADDEARRAILELREQVQRMTTQSQQSRLQLAEQLEILRQEVATLRGKVEELSFRSGQSGQNSASSPAPSISGVDPQEQVAYDAPMDAFRGGNYREAATGFSDFLNAYPDSPLAGDAQFYQGSSRYATKDFKTAIQVLQAFLNNQPNHARAPDALLVIAASQTELNDLKSTKTSLERILRDYPQSTAAETAKSRLQLL